MECLLIGYFEENNIYWEFTVTQALGLISQRAYLTLDKMAAISQHIFINEKFHISTQISLKFVPKGPIDNFATLTQFINT